MTGTFVRRAALRHLMAAAIVLALGGCAATASEHPAPVLKGGAGESGAPGSSGGPAGVTPAVTAIQGLGSTALAEVPEETGQVVVVSAPDASATESTVTLWERSGSGWVQRGPALPAHNGYGGWSSERIGGDGSSPIGVFGLSAAGGSLPDPGSRLPYDHDPVYYRTSGTFLGGDLAHAFDYVVAIDYNHVPGSKPDDKRRPLGGKAGSKIWFHVDHQSPTHGCVSIPEAAMLDLLTWLDPAAHPVVVMGPVSYLSA